MLKLCLWLGLTCNIVGQAHVQDGDTLYIGEYAIRIMGLDAEELNEPHGPAARNALDVIIGNNSVTCKTNGERSYKRYVATCFADGADVAERMVRLGYALDCARYSKGKYRSFEPEGVRSRLIQKPYC